MKSTFTLAALTALLLAAPAQAGDGHISSETLSAVGLGGMQIVSDADGMQVRGMSGGASAWGISIVTGVLLDPATKSFIAGTDTNLSGSKSSSGIKTITAFQTNFSALELGLTVNTNTSNFTGFLFGGAGGSSFASAN